MSKNRIPRLNKRMNGFKHFLLVELSKEQEKDIESSLAKLPKKHRELIKGYKFKFQPGNTLKGDGEHVGIINPVTKTVTIAAPWNYPREFTFLHELGHKVWEFFVNEKMRKEWDCIVKRTKHKQKQNAEELFCMAYANHYAKNQIEIHNHPEWDKFVKKLPK